MSLHVQILVDLGALSVIGLIAAGCGASQPSGEAGAATQSLAPGGSIGGTSVDYARGCWRSPDGARWQVTDAGTVITGYATYNHPVVVSCSLGQADQLLAESGSYTWTALVEQVGPMTEWGLLSGVAWDGQEGHPFGNYLVASQFGGGDTAWIGQFPPDWNPFPLAIGGASSPPTSAAYRLTARITGANSAAPAIDGSVDLLDAQTEQYTRLSAAHLVLTQRLPGDGVGFYTYGINSVTLRDLRLSR